MVREDFTIMENAIQDTMLNRFQNMDAGIRADEGFVSVVIFAPVSRFHIYLMFLGSYLA